MYVSVTLLKLKSLRAVPNFIKHVSAINKQISGACGLISYKAGTKWLINNYTFSVWKSKEDMMAFMTSGAHRAAMKNAGQLASDLYSKGFEAEQVPNYKEALRELEKEVRKSKKKQ